MLNAIWAAMIVTGVLYGVFTGNVEAVAEAALDSAGEAVQLCITMVEYISTNLIANILGLGWACTPAGLKAMEELAKLEGERGTSGYSDPKRGVRYASNEMCTFLIVNISSLQLIPVSVIAYRSQYGSVNPAAVIVPGILATAASTAVAVVYCKWKDRKTVREG